MFCKFKIAVFLSLRERVCSPREFAPLGVLIVLLGDVLSWEFSVGLYLHKLFTPLRTYRRKRMSMNVLAIAGSFFLFIEVLEKFRVVYGTF